jgi:hypothetical protein
VLAEVARDRQDKPADFQFDGLGNFGCIARMLWGGTVDAAEFERVAVGCF